MRDIPCKITYYYQMKKIFLYSAVSLLLLSACRTDETSSAQQVSIETQNSYDDQAIQKFLNDYYLDAQGKPVKFSAADTSDDNYPKLSSYNPVKLASGVVYLVRPNAQPTAGTTPGSSDILRIMTIANAYIARKADDVVSFEGALTFRNTVEGSGVPEVDPFYYYAKKSLREAVGKDRSYFEIEGFREAIQQFQSFNQPDGASYNMQGIIFVPSRAAYARDANVNDAATAKFTDRSFIFTFQLYKTTARPAEEL